MYIINLFLILLWGGALHWSGMTQKKKKIFCAIACAQWVLLSGLRHITVGSDTRQYKVGYFDRTLQMSWHELFSNVVNTYFGNANFKDPGYRLFEKLVQLFTTNYQIYLVIVALVFTVPMAIFIYRHSAEPCISFIIYSCLCFELFGITGIRQAIAASLMVFVGYRWLKTRNTVAYFSLGLVACTLHASAVVFLLFYLVSWKKITKLYVSCILVGVPVVLLCHRPLIQFAGQIFGYERYIQKLHGGEPWTFASLYALVIVVTIWRSTTILNKTPEASIWINAAFLGLFFAMMCFTADILLRMTYYFSLYLLVLIPEILNSFPQKERRLVYAIALFLMIGLFLRKVPPYLFFWEGSSAF